MKQIFHDTSGTLHPMESSTPPPARFTWPFCYEPHPLCLEAAAEVQRYIASVDGWSEELGRGKMFGVLIVDGEDGNLLFLAAYSGLLGGRNDWPWFVPPVFDSQQPDGYFKRREAEISDIGRRIIRLEADPHLKELRDRLDSMRQEADREVHIYKVKMAEAKRLRDIRRSQGEDAGTLIRESQFMKAELRRMKQRHAAATEALEEELRGMEAETARLRRLRHNMSDDLQRWLFGQYSVYNARGERRSLTDIFADSTGSIPPAGAGDCCAPKLLQHAYRLGLRPRCMAEFWWGASPRTEIRHHLEFYPACRGKCKPILEHMLQGLETDPDPLACDRGEDALETIYEDECLAVVLKPAGMLTVPGKSRRRSVLSIMRNRYPDADGPMIVHRLDMDTSGLLVVAKTAAAYRNLQAQFAARTVRKRYAALLDGIPQRPESGIISLPLRPDPLDRPRQCVDRGHGKSAVTRYRITATADGQALVELHPLTGRTHQLRVHCAHAEGLGTPIAGDRLYGHAAGRLFLHAERIEFCHPATGRRMAFESKAEFGI